MFEFPDELHEQIELMCEEGNELLDQEQFDAALKRFLSAWDLLPEPKTDCDAAAWILSAIADVHFSQNDFVAMRGPLMAAMRCDGSTENPFLRLRLGQCLFELGELEEAANWLTGAFLLEGTKIFAEDAPKYLTFIKSKLSPPPGGWPEGW